MNTLAFHPDLARNHAIGVSKHRQAVVDQNLRVRGVDGLWVIDASIMPAVVSGNTNAAVIAIAEKGADLLLRS